MSVSVNQLLEDVKRLAGRLKDHDSSADLLITEAQAMFRQIDAMKEFQEELVELNAAANQRPHAALVMSIQQENRQLRDLQTENKELKSALEENQNALELIMSKYRQQISRLLEVGHTEKSLADVNVNSQKLVEQAERIGEMIAVMERAAKLDDDFNQKEAELFSKLSTENKGLREILQVAARNGSAAVNLLSVTEEKQVQTDDAT